MPIKYFILFSTIGIFFLVPNPAFAQSCIDIPVQSSIDSCDNPGVGAGQIFQPNAGNTNCETGGSNPILNCCWAIGYNTCESYPSGVMYGYRCCSAAVSCPLAPEPGRIIVSPLVPLVSNVTSLSSYGPITTSVPPGAYRVTLVSYDDHSSRPPQFQPIERWYLSTDTSGNTGTISDLPSNDDWITEVVNPNFVVGSTITSVTARHAGTPASPSSNRHTAVCAAFDIISTPTPTPIFTPTPTPTNTPTPTPSGNSISGNVFVDRNTNKLNGVGESNYAGNINITSVNTSSGNPTGTITYPSPGEFAISELPVGTYTISYDSALNLSMTFPTTGVPPPSFDLTVGPLCDASAANPPQLESPPQPPSPLAGTCVGENIINANFGVTHSPWFQSVGLNMRIDAGFSDPISEVASPAFASLVGAGGTPGIIFSGSTNPSFGAATAQASSRKWTVGTTSYPETFTPFPPNVIKTSYEYLLAFAQRNGITPTDISTPPRCIGGLSDCKFNPVIPPSPTSGGLFIANGDLVFVGTSPGGNPYTFQNNRDIVILVNGDFIIKQKILVPTTSTVTFAVKGDIKIDGNVGESDSTSTASSIEGYYSAGKNIIIRDDTDDTNDSYCPTPDPRLNVAGALITNASLTGGSLQNQRDVCGEGEHYPVFYIKERPDFILNSPQLIRSAQTVWQEVAP